MALSTRTRRSMMWLAWTVMCVAGAMLIGLKVGRPLYYSDGSQEVAGSDLSDAGMLRWNSPDAEFELPGKLTGRVAQLPDGRLIYGILTEDGTSDLVTWHPDRPDVPPEPAYGLNTDRNELAPAVAKDGRIYFASDRAESIGGYDLFVTSYTPRGFARVEALSACNTALDETDPAPDPRGISLVFVRIDRSIDNGNDGVLFSWSLGDVLDPAVLFPEQDRRRDLVIDRDPAFSDDGAGLWFVRKERGKPLQVCRSSRLGQKFAAPSTLSEHWNTQSLRSPLPMQGGRALALVQPPTAEQPALCYVSIASELVPWWPGQHWLEWLLASLLVAALLLLLLLYFGQRWSALDLVAQCLLLSLLLHILLFLWLMGVEIAGSLLPGSDDQDDGMQVSILASASAANAAAMGGAMDVAAMVQRTVREQDFAVATPGTETARSEPDPTASLAVANGDYQAEPEQRTALATNEQPLLDAVEAMAALASEDAAAALSPAEFSAVAQAQPAVDQAAQRSAASAAAASSEMVAVVTPGSGVQRAEARMVALPNADAAQAMPQQTTEGSAALAAGAPAKPTLQDQASGAERLASAVAIDAASAEVGMSALANTKTANTPQAATLAAPKRGAAGASDQEAVALPGSSIAATDSAAIAMKAAERRVAVAAPRKLNMPAMPRLADAAGKVAGNAEGNAEGSANKLVPGDPAAAAVAAPRATVAVREVAALVQPGATDVAAERSQRAGAVASPAEVLPAPGSLLRRSAPAIAMRTATGQQVPLATRRGGVAVALRDAMPSGVGLAKPKQSAAKAAGAAGQGVLALGLDLPSTPAARPSFAPRRQASQRSNQALALADRLVVTPPASQLLRAEARTTVLPEPVPLAAKPNAYSNRFGPAKTQALERFGGTTETERAVRDGLRYLASIQNRNGSWGDNRDFDSKYGFVYIGKTALCVLAFLGAGHTPTSATEYSANVGKAIAHLLSVQDTDTGAFGRSSCYGHGIATYAIAECYGLTKDRPYSDQLAKPLEDSLTWILANQGPRRDPRNQGGWGYFSPGLRAEDNYARVSVSSWMIMALESARLSGVELPEDVLPAARQFLELSFDQTNGWFRYNHVPSRLRSGWPTLPASTPAGGFCMMLLGAEADHHMVQAAVDYTVERRPQRYRRYGDDDFVLRGQGNVYFWYYGSLCCFLKGGDAWQQWNARLSTVLPAAQQADGSFPPIDVYAEEAGDNARDRSYTTAMCVLSLEVYYRYFTPLLLGR